MRTRSGARIVSWTWELSWQVSVTRLSVLIRLTTGPIFSSVVMSCAKADTPATKIHVITRKRFISFYRINKMFSGFNLVSPEKSCKSCLTNRSEPGAPRLINPHHPHTSHARSSHARPVTETHAPRPAGACVSQTGPNHSPLHHPTQSSRD